VRESTRRSPALSTRLRSIQRASNSAKSWMVSSDPTGLVLLSAIVCPRESNERNDPLPASPPEGGRCTLPLGEFTVHPLGSMAREATRAIRFLGLRALFYGSPEAGGRRRRRIRTVSQSLLLSPQRMSAERKQMPQVVEIHRSR
jgi:hypothetical protein